MQTYLELRKDFVKKAAQLGDHAKCSIDDLATNYVTAMDNQERAKADIYFSALVLRFWYKVPKFRREGGGIFDDTDYIMWLQEGIVYACKYRAWLNPAKKVNAQQAINQCISTIRSQHYYKSNSLKNRASYNLMSLDVSASPKHKSTIVSAKTSPMEEETLLDGQEGDLNADAGIGAKIIVQNILDENKIIEAIIVDTIAFNSDAQEDIIKTKVTNEDGEDVVAKSSFYSFKRSKLSHALASIKDFKEDFKEYFSKKYVVDDKKFEISLNELSSVKDYKLNLFIEKTIETLAKYKDELLA